MYALDEPNGNYSSMVLAYRSSTLSTPVCIGGECHAELSGPAVLFSHQVILSLVLGFFGSDLQSSGNTSSLKLSGRALFLESISGGDGVDVYDDGEGRAGALIWPGSSPANHFCRFPLTRGRVIWIIAGSFLEGWPSG